MYSAWNPNRTRWLVAQSTLVLTTGLMATCPAAAAQSMDANRLRQHVEVLASDRLEGRETGTSGIDLAEEYIAETFASGGLEPFPGAKDFYNDFELVNAGFSMETCSLDLARGDEHWEAEPGSDYRPFPFSATGDVTGALVFAGYGITAPEYGWDDYANLDVRGRIVVVLRYEPGRDDPESPFNGTSNSSHAYFTSKERNARQQGAIGMIVVQGPLHGDEPRRLPFQRGLALEASNADNDDAPDANGESIAAVHVRRRWLQTALSRRDIDLRTLQEQVEDGVRPADLPTLPLSVSMRLQRRPEGTTAARNVVAFVPGSDPELSHELIVVGAHHDHVGVGSTGSDRIFNGADDNASGTAVLLELAAAWRQRHPAPARSVVFVTFTAEEKGLLGSRALVQSGLLPLDNVRFMINLDMVGRNAHRPVQVYADPRARGLRDIVAKANRNVDVPLDFENGRLPGNSDHSSFRNEEIPVLFFFTGTHDDYHRPGDHADKLDYERMADIGTLTFGLLEELADARGDAFPNPTLDLYWLGAELTIEGSPAGVHGILSAIADNSRASQAGLQVGDVITGIHNDRLQGDRRIGRRLQDLEPQQPVELTLERHGSATVVQVTRPQPGFLGIAYAALSVEDRRLFGIADGEGVVVQQVLAEGPASTAGLLVGDIILRVANEPVRHDELVGRMQAFGAHNTVEMQILRDGETLQRRVQLAERPPAG